MELWIRSQDERALLNVRQVRINGLDIMCLGGELLGTYISNERALEVLNEIEERIMLINSISLTQDKNSLIAFKNVVGEERLNGLGYPYQMPKE